MALKRRQFTREFKLQVVREVDVGKPMAQAARQHQINPNTVAKWRKQLRQYPQTAFAEQGRAYTDEARVAELERIGRSPHHGKRFAKKSLSLARRTGVLKDREWLKQVTELISQSKPERALALAPACAALGISRATLYRRRNITAEADTEVRDAIQRIALEMPCYGYRRITAELCRRSFKVNHKAVLRADSAKIICSACGENAPLS